MTSKTPEELEADIAVQREQLADTVNALSAKLDVKAQAKARVDGAKATTTAKVADARATTTAKVADLKDRATTAEGRARPELLVFGGTVLVLTAALVWWRRR